MYKKGDILFHKTYGRCKYVSPDPVSDKYINVDYDKRWAVDLGKMLAWKKNIRPEPLQRKIVV